MEHPDQIVETDTAAQVEKRIPLARPVGATVETSPPPPPDPRDEILLLSHSRRAVMADILLFVVLFLPLSLVGELAIGSVYRAVMADRFSDEDSLTSAVARAALFPAIGWRALAATAVGVWLTRRRGLSFRSVGLTLRRFWPNLLWGITAFAVIMVAAIVSGLLIQALFPALSREFEKNAQLIMDAVPKVSPAFFFCVCLAIGYYEELVFRGILMPRLRRATGSWTVAVVGSSAVFVALHLMDQAPAALLAVGSLSLIFSIVTIWRSSLVPAIFAHALFDFVMFLQLYYAAGDQWK
jgi:membrane protease YdiL (CAAX protease family)